jgi:hypothetical protein
MFAAAVVDRIWTTDNLTPTLIDELRHRFDSQILGGAYWDTKRSTARYATLIWLRQVQPWTTRLHYKPQNMRAWYILDGTAPSGISPATDPPPVTATTAPHQTKRAPQPSTRPSTSPSAAPSTPDFLIPLTDSNLHHHHVRLGPFIDRFPSDALGGSTRASAGRSIALHLHAGPIVLTDIVQSSRMFRWRGWGPWFAASGLNPGDRLRFTPRSGRAFDVHPLPAQQSPSP